MYRKLIGTKRVRSDPDGPWRLEGIYEEIHPSDSFENRTKKEYLERCPELTAELDEHQIVMQDGRQIRYCREMDSWFYWDLDEWVRDPELIIPRDDEVWDHVSRAPLE